MMRVLLVLLVLAVGGAVVAVALGEQGDRVRVWLDGVSPGPVHPFELHRVGRRWRVVGDSAFGLV